MVSRFVLLSFKPLMTCYPISTPALVSLTAFCSVISFASAMPSTSCLFFPHLRCFPVLWSDRYSLHWIHLSCCHCSLRDGIATMKDKILSVFMIALAVFSNLIAIYSDATAFFKQKVSINAWFYIVQGLLLDE